MTIHNTIQMVMCPWLTAADQMLTLQSAENTRLGGKNSMAQHFQAKWVPVRVKKMRSNKKSECRFDFTGSQGTPQKQGGRYVH